MSWDNHLPISRDVQAFLVSLDVCGFSKRDAPLGLLDARRDLFWAITESPTFCRAYESDTAKSHFLGDELRIAFSYDTNPIDVRDFVLEVVNRLGELDRDKYNDEVTLVKGVILHGGHGTRLRPFTHTGPKQLIPVANKPISQYVLEDIKNSDIKNIAIILGGTYPEKVQEYYGNGSRFGVKLNYIDQREPKGIAHAVGLCERFVGDDDFIVYLGDNLLKGGIRKYTEKFGHY